LGRKQPAGKVDEVNFQIETLAYQNGPQWPPHLGDRSVTKLSPLANSPPFF